MRILQTLLLALVVGFMLAQQPDENPAQPSLYQELQDFPEIVTLIDRAYVDSRDIAQLMDGSFQGALEAVDPGSGFYAAHDSFQLDPWSVANQTGMVLAKQQGRLRVLSVFPKSAAALAELRAGDWVLAINGKKARHLPLHAALSECSADTIELLLARDDMHTQVQTRKQELPKSNFQRFDDGGVLIELPQFESNLDLQLAQHESWTSEAPYIVIDLRLNALPFDPAIGILGQRLFGSGPFASLASSHGVLSEFSNRQAGQWTHKRVVVLQDESTAATAEAICALVAAHQCGVLVGQKTLGLPYHYQAIAIKSGGTVVLSTKQIAPTSGAGYIGVGVKPAHLISLTGSEALDAALKIARQSPL